MPTPEELRQRLIRNFHDGPLERLERPPRYDTQSRSLTDGTAARKLGATFDIVAPGKQSCPYHLHHAQEEMFVILQGEGTLRVAGELLPVRAGDVISIPPGPEYPHHLLNTSDAPLHYLSIGTQQWPDVCEYPDSGKVSAMPGPSGWRLRQRLENTLDYWDGEP